MKCLVLVSGMLLDFKWLKRDKSATDGSYQLIDPRYYHSIILGESYGSEVTITNTTEDDFGLYTCYASNHIGAEYNSAFLSRYVRPTSPSKRGKML